MSVEAPAPAPAPALPAGGTNTPAAPAASGASGTRADSAAPATAPHCDNCGASVTGRYCGVCGQRLEPPLHSLGHFARIATEDLTHADSRVWRTLGALLARPGLLTREFLAGRRARYLPPVRLYLVVSVVFFLWAALTQSGNVVHVDDDDLAPPTAKHAQAPPPKGNPATSAAPAAASAPAGAAANPPGAIIIAPGQTHSEKDCDGLTYDGPWAARVQPLVRESCRKMIRDNGRSVGEAMVHNMPHAMFIFLPLLAAAMMLFYWRPRRYYVEHLLFLVHNHAFVFVFVMLCWALAALIPPIGGLIGFAATCYMVWYVFRAMRVVYAQGRALTILKLCVLSFLYLISAALMLAATAVYSVLSV
jgi:hypothetical protein